MAFYDKYVSTTNKITFYSENKILLELLDTLLTLSNSQVLPTRNPNYAKQKGNKLFFVLSAKRYRSTNRAQKHQRPFICAF